jgi:hypothetical protein
VAAALRAAGEEVGRVAVDAARPVVVEEVGEVEL